MNLPTLFLPLREAWLIVQDKVTPALGLSVFVAKFAHGIGRVGKISKDRYGVEIPLGSVLDEQPGIIRPTKKSAQAAEASTSAGTSVEEVSCMVPSWPVRCIAMRAMLPKAVAACRN